MTDHEKVAVRDLGIITLGMESEPDMTSEAWITNDLSQQLQLPVVECRIISSSQRQPIRLLIVHH